MPHHLLSDPARFDLDAYCARIGYDGPRAANIDVLRELHLRHAQAIAFENINPLLRWPVALDTASLVRKLIHDGRGGYCFEQNLLFAHALHGLGFHFDGLAARVTYGAPPGTINARSHMLLRIELHDVTWIADVGFGGMTLTGPVTLTLEAEQATPHEPFRLTRAGSDFVLEARVGEAWTPLYRFGLEPAYLVDYETSSWFLCNFPRSHFVNGLVAARPMREGRYALRNRLFTTYFRDGRAVRRVLSTAGELRAVLEREMALRLPASPELETALDRVSAMPEPARLEPVAD